MNFQHFKSFVVIADQKSITAAAKEMYITPASLLQQINLFEAELGFKVFNRSRKGVSLTQAGKRLYDGCQHLFSETNQLLAECKHLAQIDMSSIRISLAKPYYLTKLSKDYCSQHSDIHIDFDRIDPLTDQNVLQYFSEGEYDMIQVLYDPADIDNLPYEIIPYPVDRLCCVCTSQHPLNQKQSVSLQDLNGCTLETFSNFSTPINVFEQQASQQQLAINVCRSLFSERAVLKCCINDNIYLLEEQVARSFTYLSCIPITPTIPCYIGLAYMKDAKPAVKSFAQYIRNHIDAFAAQYQHQ